MISMSPVVATTYVDVPNVVAPSPEPALPAGSEAFTPPITTETWPPGAPAVAEWTRTAEPDSIIALTGSRLSSYTGATAGEDTQFEVFGQGAAGQYTGTATLQRLDGMKAALVLPAGLPVNSEYLVWPVNAAGVGAPVAVNATESWWVGPNVATRGDTASVYGRNLSQALSGQSQTANTSHVYIQMSGQAGEWAAVTAANPYKVDFTVPADLADGSYQVWIHNGHGGHYGWSGPLMLTVNDGMPWTAQQFNVKSYGAKGDGVTDDQAAIEAAMVAAAGVPWSTVYLPAGTYMVSSGFNPPSKVRWLGDGATQTLIRANSGFVKPAIDNPRRYALMFTNGVVNNVVFQGLTLDANGNMNGVLQEPIYMRFDSDIRFINTTINGKGHGTADFHGSTRLSFENCDIIGGGNGVFFGSATQVHINNCRVYGTNDVNTMLTFWGGDSMSCTNTSGQDYDNTKADGWAQGRFFYGSSQWGSNRNIYVGDSTTRALAVRPAVPDQNTGEQMLWENGTRYSGLPVSATATTVVFPSGSFFTDAGLGNGSYDAVVVNGTGLGQHRKIVGHSGSSLSVSPAWNVPPDTGSTVIVAGVVSRCAIYHNTLQGKNTYATQVTASTGVQPYGNSYDFVVDSNSISQMRNGINVWGMGETSLTPQSVTCAYFNYIANNNISNCMNGITGISQAWNGWPANDPYPGISYLGNTCAYNQVSTMLEESLEETAETAPVGDQVDLNVFDHDQVTNSPTGINLQPDSKINNSITYKNVVQLSASAGQ